MYHTCYALHRARPQLLEQQIPEVSEKSLTGFPLLKPEYRNWFFFFLFFLSFSFDYSETEKTDAHEGFLAKH